MSRAAWGPESTPARAMTTPDQASRGISTLGRRRRNRVPSSAVRGWDRSSAPESMKNRGTAAVAREEIRLEKCHRGVPSWRRAPAAVWR